MLLVRQESFLTIGVVGDLRDGELALRVFVLKGLMEDTRPFEPLQCLGVSAGSFGAGVEFIAGLELLFLKPEFVRPLGSLGILLELQEAEYFGHLIAGLASYIEGLRGIVFRFVRVT